MRRGFCVLRIKARGHRELVTVVGHAAVISAGEWITASGEWINDRTHGQQYKAKFLKTSEPTSLDGIEKYLGNTFSPKERTSSLACWAMRAVSSAVASRFRHSGSSTSASFAARISSIGLLKRSAKSCGPGEPFAGMPSRCAFANATSTNALQAVELMLVRRTKVFLSLESSRV